jgi:hypothetical protein
MDAPIKYEITKVRDYIYCVNIPNRYDRAMTFCRAQEFYESPNPNFKGKAFSIWDYIKWYSLTNGKGFSYGLDWSGFNIPIQTIKECYTRVKNKYGTKELTIYDHTLIKIVKEIEENSNSLKHTLSQSYLIGVDGIENSTFKHEVCHGLYSTNKDYNRKAKSLVSSLKRTHKRVYQTLKRNLLKMGYSSQLVDDEIQAYLQFGATEKEFCNGVEKSTVMTLSEKYRKELYDAFSKN